MATGGRPVERPVHLAPQARREAQARTAAWRNAAGLSQREIAARLNVGYSTYRMWESGTENYSGPTQAQAQRLDAVLSALLASGYTAGEALAAWGWPADLDLDYSAVTSFLRVAGFAVPAAPVAPGALLWVHRLREPNIVHGVLALAAAAATRARVPVTLLLDDEAASAGTRDRLHAEFAECVGTWFDFAGGHRGQLTIKLYSSILTSELLASRAWTALHDYLSTETGVLEFLLASKVVSPLQHNADAEQSVLELLRQGQSLRAGRLLTPVRNWLVFDAELAALAAGPPDSRSPILTLGGEDERILWEIWHRGAAEKLSARVQHLYHRPLPLPSYRVPWQERALTARTTTRPLLTDFLRSRSVQHDPRDLNEWMLAAAVGLPAALNDGFRKELTPDLARLTGLRQVSAEQLTRLAPSIAEAVTSWLGA